MLFSSIGLFGSNINDDCSIDDSSLTSFLCYPYSAATARTTEDDTPYQYHYSHGGGEETVGNDREEKSRTNTTTRSRERRWSRIGRSRCRRSRNSRGGRSSLRSSGRTRGGGRAATTSATTNHHHNPLPSSVAASSSLRVFACDSREEEEEEDSCTTATGGASTNATAFSVGRTATNQDSYYDGCDDNDNDECTTPNNPSIIEDESHHEQRVNRRGKTNTTRLLDLMTEEKDSLIESLNAKITMLEESLAKAKEEKEASSKSHDERVKELNGALAQKDEQIAMLQKEKKSSGRPASSSSAHNRFWKKDERLHSQHRRHDETRRRYVPIKKEGYYEPHHDERKHHFDQGICYARGYLPRTREDEEYDARNGSDEQYYHSATSPRSSYYDNESRDDEEEVAMDDDEYYTTGHRHLRRDQDNTAATNHCIKATAGRGDTATMDPWFFACVDPINTGVAGAGGCLEDIEHEVDEDRMDIEENRSQASAKAIIKAGEDDDFSECMKSRTTVLTYAHVPTTHTNLITPMQSSSSKWKSSSHTRRLLSRGSQLCTKVPSPWRRTTTTAWQSAKGSGSRTKGKGLLLTESHNILRQLLSSYRPSNGAKLEFSMQSSSGVRNSKIDTISNNNNDMIDQDETAIAHKRLHKDTTNNAMRGGRGLGRTRVASAATRFSAC